MVRNVNYFALATEMVVAVAAHHQISARISQCETKQHNRNERDVKLFAEIAERYFLII